MCLKAEQMCQFVIMAIYMKSNLHVFGVTCFKQVVEHSLLWLLGKEIPLIKQNHNCLLCPTHPNNVVSSCKYM